MNATPRLRLGRRERCFWERDLRKTREPICDSGGDWVKGYKTIIARESSGNCNACNVWDSNAITPPGFRRVKDFGDGYTRQGIVRLNGRLTPFQCSRGIVQCIPQTFAHYHVPGTTRNIYDPVASIAASMRYVMSRYKVAKNGSNLARNVQQADPTRPPKGY